MKFTCPGLRGNHCPKIESWRVSAEFEDDPFCGRLNPRPKIPEMPSFRMGFEDCWLTASTSQKSQRTVPTGGARGDLPVWFGYDQKEPFESFAPQFSLINWPLREFPKKVVLSVPERSCAL